jgi:signal transduction histidine kinase
MPKGGTLGIRVHRESTIAVITVSDTGTGIPGEILPRIFDPFFTTKKKGEGTGMGLQIVRQIIEGYGGSISVESVPGNTAFTIRLPVATEADLQLHQVAPAELTS